MEDQYPLLKCYYILPLKEEFDDDQHGAASSPAVALEKECLEDAEFHGI